MRAEHKKSEEEIHYQSITKFLLWAVGITGALMVTIAGTSIYFSFQDRKEMKAEYKETLDAFISQIKEAKQEARQESRETEKNLFERSRYDIASTKDDYRNELSLIQSETHRLALDETQKQIADIFKTDKIQAIIEKNAIGELKDKLPSTIADYTKKLPKVLEAANWMREGSQKGVDLLKSYFNSENEFERDMSKKIYEDLLTDYRKKYSEYTPKQCIDTLKNFGIGIPNLHPIVNNRYPTDKDNIDVLTILMSILNDSYLSNRCGLYGQALAIKCLALISGKSFQPFEIYEINQWFDGLKK